MGRLGYIACRFEGKPEYDARNMRFTNLPEANQYLKPAMRIRMGAKAVNFTRRNFGKLALAALPAGLSA